MLSQSWSGSKFIKCSISSKDNILFVERLPLKQDVLYNSCDYTQVNSKDSFFFSVPKIMQLFQQKSALFGSIEYFQHNVTGNLCISIDKEDALIECQNGDFIRITSNSTELINKIKAVIL